MMRREADCRIYWGTHGCQLPRGHDGTHRCWCCECEDHADPAKRIEGCVGAAPYYGPGTHFYGEDAE